jgi:WD40 repeat protein
MMLLYLVSGVTGAAYNHNGSLLVYGGEEGKVGLADLNRAEMLASWQGHERAVTCLALSQDETAVWSLGREGSLLRSSLLRLGERLWSACLGPPPPHGLPPRMAIAPDGEHILASTDAGGVVYRFVWISFLNQTARARYQYFQKDLNSSFTACDFELEIQTGLNSTISF